MRRARHAPCPTRRGVSIGIRAAPSSPWGSPRARCTCSRPRRPWTPWRARTCARSKSWTCASPRTASTSRRPPTTTSSTSSTWAPRAARCWPTWAPAAGTHPLSPTWTGARMARTCRAPRGTWSSSTGQCQRAGSPCRAPRCATRSGPPGPACSGGPCGASGSRAWTARTSTTCAAAARRTSWPPPTISGTSVCLRGRRPRIIRRAWCWRGTRPT
mmetsp:Transcript_6725/g.22961  ORF Transcript_6725/g.22961 Transcript_6725/m.22961 type:complete len:215 (-) Transcript_6725:154-798(-)